MTVSEDLSDSEGVSENSSLGPTLVPVLPGVFVGRGLVDISVLQVAAASMIRGRGFRRRRGVSRVSSALVENSNFVSLLGKHTLLVGEW